MTSASSRHLNILGIRGIPAAHGGFETFAEHFSLYMRDAGWTVAVYCQAKEGVSSPQRHVDEWRGITRIHFDTRTRNTLATMEFDMRSVLDVLGRPGVDLVLGYNTAVFSLLQRVRGRRFAMNMDGIEWKRSKWSAAARAWFWGNEWIGSRLCTTPIADHPQIAAHLAARGCPGAVVIPYGSDVISDAPVEPVAALGLVPQDYFISIARIEPENSILEVIEAFVRVGTGRRLVVLGKLTPDTNAYHRQVRAAANGQVLFPGAIYDQEVVRALRFHCLAYIHGHQVGGTNPSLVEALGAGNPVIAHDNRFNRWTAGEGQSFFRDREECAEHMSRFASGAVDRQERSELARARHRADFLYESVHRKYLDALSGLER